MQHIAREGDTVAVAVRSVAATACCPLCSRTSQRIHSRYVRKLADLPWHGRRVRVDLEVRRFACGFHDCVRRIFAERLPTVATRYARTTVRLRDTHRAIGFALGGEAGARLTIRL